MEIGGGALGPFAVGLLHDGTSWPLAIALAGHGLMMMGCYLPVVTARRGAQ